MKVKKGQILLKNEYKYWEFWAFLAELGGYEWANIHGDNHKQAEIGYRRYLKNRERHLNPNSRFMKMRQEIRK
jgi:hypothetical protein